MTDSLRTRERLILIKNKIDTILEICEGRITEALEDEKLKRPAILMHLVACNKQLQKIQDSGDTKALSVFTSDDIRGIRGVRNTTAHDYEGVNLAIIEDVIRYYLPNIKSNIEKFLEAGATESLNTDKNQKKKRDNGNFR